MCGRLSALLCIEMVKQLGERLADAVFVSRNAERVSARGLEVVLRAVLRGGRGIQAFHIAQGADLNGAVDVDEGEAGTKDVFDEFAMLLGGGDESADEGEALIRQEFGEVSGAAEVFAAVFVRVAQVGAETGAEVIAVEEDDGAVLGAEMVPQGGGESGFPAAGKSEKPDDAGTHAFRARSF
jgi:hypothetical protein